MQVEALLRKVYSWSVTDKDTGEVNSGFSVEYEAIPSTPTLTKGSWGIDSPSKSQIDKNLYSDLIRTLSARKPEPVPCVLDGGLRNSKFIVSKVTLK
jgi:hypothetical protein